MMSLLLTFFILLVAMSKLKKEDQYRAIVQEVQRAFGMKGGGAKLPTEEDPRLSMLDLRQHQQIMQRPEPNRSQSDDPGIDGHEQAVTTIREGMKFLVGGRITFETGSADLSDKAREDLRVIGRQLQGLNHKIELRGHAASMELAEELAYPDLWTLSYARARAVMAYLVSDDIGIRPDRIRLIAAGDREPLARREYTADRLATNRRVEIWQLDVLVEDFNFPQAP
jgi:chemotaxis protein MotB